MSDFEDEDDGSNVDDYKRKRHNNNLSVKKTREKQKKLVEEATAEVDAYKTENENLKDKYESLKKELNLYKSLFTQRLDSSSLTSTSSTSNNDNESNKRQKVSSSSDKIEQQPLEKQYTTNIDDLLNLPETPIIVGINEQNPAEVEEEEKANTPISLLLNDDYQVNGIISNENIIISKQNSSKDEEEINKKKRDDELETQQTNSRYERKKTIPMPFHHEYAFIEKSIKKK
jgi:hypothetical protein